MRIFEPMKIAIHFPVYKRVKIRNIAMDCLDRVRADFARLGIETEVCVIGDDKDVPAVCEARGYRHFEVENKPLGRKFEMGLRWMLRHMEFDYMMEFCSDNILRKDYPTLMAKALKDGQAWVAHDQFYIVDSVTGKTHLFSKRGQSNVGRCTSRKLIEASQKHLNRCYDYELMSGLDASFRTNISRCTDRLTYLLKTPTPLIIDIKSQTNINMFSGFARKPTVFPPTEVIGDFPELSQLKHFNTLDHANNGENSL